MSWIACGLGCGIAASATLTILRWGTAEPYSPFLIPFDLLVLGAGGALLFLVPAAVARRGGDRAARLAATSLVVLVLGVYWAWRLYGTGGGLVLKLCSLALLAAGFGAALRHLLRRTGAGPGLVWLCLGCGVGVAVSVLGAPVWPPLSLAFPLVVAVFLVVGLPRPRPGFARWTGLGAAAVVLLLCATTLAPWSRQRVGTTMHVAPREGRSVILIVVDTLRQDHLSLHGYPRRTTPNLDAWSREGMVFDNSVAASSWTLPTHASLLTGLAPRSHGAHGYRGTKATGNAYRLSENHVTLAEVAAAGGFETGAIVANVAFVNHGYGLDQGFRTFWAPASRPGVELPPSEWLAMQADWWRYISFRWPYYRCRYVTDNVIRWLEAARGRPFFLFVNYMDVHVPNARRPLGEVPLENEIPATVHHYDLWDFLAGSAPLAEGVRRDLINNYDRELIYLDRQFRRLFDYLEHSGLSASTTVIVTADHGEYFGEHGLVMHGHHLHEEVVRVPLILKGPGIPAGRNAKPVQSVDVFPTVLQLLDLTYGGAMHGVSLLGNDSRPAVSEWYAASNPRSRSAEMSGRFDRDIRAFRDGSLKLFTDERGRVELYDLAVDPGEATDLAARDPAAVSRLQARLETWLAEHPPADTPGESPQLSPEESEQLRALGYLK